MSDHMDTIFDSAIEHERQWVAFWVVHATRSLRAQCQSPIEEMLALALWSKCPWRGQENNGIRPQVDIGPYRVDFLIDYRDYRRQLRSQLVVEVDGHDFHEKTKEQVRHDKARDRYLLGQGLQAARFAGSEVYADAFKCADEAWQLAASIAQGLPEDPT